MFFLIFFPNLASYQNKRVAVIELRNENYLKSKCIKVDTEFIQVDTLITTNFNCKVKSRQTEIECQGW